MIVTFEGIDGAGKTTVSRLLFEKLQAQLSNVQYFKRSSANYADDFVRRKMHLFKDVLWSSEVRVKERNPFGDPFWVLALASWFAVMEECRFKPAADGDVIIIESWFYRSIAKFVCKGYDQDWLFSFFKHVRRPDRVVLLDIDPVTSWKRRKDFSTFETGRWDGFRGDPMVGYTRFQAPVRSSLLNMARQNSWWIVPEGSGSADEVAGHLASRLLLDLDQGRPQCRSLAK